MGNPREGDGFFDQLDIIAALNANVYLKGPYAALGPGQVTAASQGPLARVPEPTGLFLLAVGLLGPAAWLRRRRLHC